MWKELKVWYRKESINRWVLEMHDPLFLLKEDLEKKREGLEDVMAFLVTQIADLEGEEGKDEATIVRERWQAIKFRKGVEDYRIAIMKLTELIDNLPELPKIVKYDIQMYNDFNHPDD